MKNIHLIRIPDRGVTEKLVTFMDDFVLEKAGQGEWLLDIGCGRGVFTRKLGEKFKNITGIDIVKEVIFKGGGHDRGGTFAIMDANQLGLRAEIFDTVISRYVFHHLDLKRAPQEVIRCLKPGGKFVMVDVEESFYRPGSRIRSFFFGVKRIGLINFLKILPDMLAYVFTKETRAHRREDILRLKRETRFTSSDFIKTYKRFFPGAEVGIYRWSGYVVWQKPK
jgi:ubiquinone/menaquinone biosynthesis C-methylase UbiE